VAAVILVVDIVVKRTPSYTVASLARVGPWKNNVWRPEIRQLEKWARKKKLLTGKYLLYESSGRSTNRRRWEACIEIKGQAQPKGRIRIKKIPAETVASVTFNPDRISPRLVYHGLNDWLKWRIRDGTFKAIGSGREVYSGNPWTNARAWAKTDVQIIVKRKRRS
jgi:DNA gyrase inhibitor GyrI